MDTLLLRGGSCDFAQDDDAPVIARAVAASTRNAIADRSAA